MSRLNFIYQRGPGSDETSLYKVAFNKPLTVQEFIEEVLKRDNEHGYIIFNNGERIDFRYGNLTNGNIQGIKDRTISSIVAVGGWTYMSYDVNI